MLFSCLAFGFAVSSFAHRRQSQDPFQTIVYLIVLIPTALWGYYKTANARLVLLQFIPLATCAAMAISIMGHSLCLRPRPFTHVADDEEKRRMVIPGDFK